MRVEALAPHGMHDSVLISSRKSVIICVMLGASPIAPKQCVRLEWFSIVSGRGDHSAPIKMRKCHTRAHYVRVEGLGPYGMHDSVLISGRKSVIICVMLGASHALSLPYSASD